MIKIEFPDGSKKEFKKDITPAEIASSVSKSLAKRALGAVVNGAVVDLSHPL
ncbi:MAG: TGS domain-containing protein, partial [Candidatus Zixiibacteriota bacterium]